MIQTIIVHPVEAPETNVVVDITEKLCKSYCILGQVQPTATVTITAGVPTVADEIAIFPMTAVVTVESPVAGKCGCVHTEVFRESFKLAMPSTGDNALTIVEGTVTNIVPAYTKCCTAHGVNITKSFSATIA